MRKWLLAVMLIAVLATSVISVAQTAQAAPSQKCFQGQGYNNITNPQGNHNYVWFSVGREYNGHPSWQIYPPPGNLYFKIASYSMNEVPSNGIARVYFRFAVLPYWLQPRPSTWLLCSR